MEKNVIQIKFIGPDQISVSREIYQNGEEKSLECVYKNQEFTDESITGCLKHFLNSWNKKMFVPRLENESGHYYGEIGKLTNLIDINEKQLCVGDVVLVYDANLKSKEVSVVCENSKYINSKDGPRYEIMGYFGLKWEKGFNHKDYFIIKFTSFEKMKHNDNVHALIYKLEK